MLKMWLFQYRKTNLGIHPRLQNTLFFFDSAYALLLQYCHDKDILSQNDAIRLHRSFRELLMVLVQQQTRRVTRKPFGDTDTRNYLERICTLYKEGRLSIASSVEYFEEDKHDGVIHRNRLYLRGDKLITYFPETNMQEIVDALVSQGVLEIGKNNRTKQISALKGLRFYVIPLKYVI